MPYMPLGMALIMEDRGVGSFDQRFAEFQAHDESRYAWIKDLENERADLIQKYKLACNDLKIEREGRRLAQEREEELRHKYEALHSSLDDNSFVLVLIDADADGYLFDEKYLIEGLRGGANAAHDLKCAIQEYFVKDWPHLVKLPLMVKAYANIDGLSTALRRAGMLEAADRLPLFALGFSQADSLFDFVAVGNGKERADHKIRGVLDQFIQNPTCKHVVFGGCHDNGYVRSLEGFARNIDIRNRLCLLQSFEIGREFLSLPFHSFKLEGVFRDCPLPRPTPPSPVKRMSADQNTLAIGIEKSGISYAAKARIVGSPEVTSPSALKSKPTIPAGFILMNLNDERIDEALGQPPVSAIDSFNKKTKVDGERYCNMFHLQGQCPERLCRYSHDPLSDAEVHVLRVLMRAQVCTAGLECRKANCFYGHNCVPGCVVRKCRFNADMHTVERRGIKQVKGC